MSLDIFQWSLSNEYRRSKRSSSRRLLPCFLMRTIRSTPKDVIRRLHRLRRQKRETTKMRKKHKRGYRSEEHTSELQSRSDLVCRLLLEKKKNTRRRALRGP